MSRARKPQPQLRSPYREAPEWTPREDAVIRAATSPCTALRTFPAWQTARRPADGTRAALGRFSIDRHATGGAGALTGGGGGDPGGRVRRRGRLRHCGNDAA